MRFPFFRAVFLPAVILSLFLLTGCPGRKAVSNAPKAEAKAGPGHTFVIALLPRENIFYQKRRYDLLADYLSRALGLNVQTRLLDSYDSVYNEMFTGKVDAAFFGGLSYVVMDSKINIDPIARPVYSDGRSSYRGVIFARRDGGITGNVSTWRGKRIALASKSTTSGYLFPRWYLYNKGVKEFGGYFGRIFYVGSLDAAIHAVMDNKVDIGCSTDRLFDKYLIKNPAARSSLLILATSGPFPSGTLGVKKGSLDPHIEKLLKETLLGMDQTDEGRAVLSLMRATRFIETRKSDYDRIDNMMRELGLGPDFFELGGIGHDVSDRQSGRP
jgi:phosphonate transport system substrate-binding protein